MCVLSVCVLRRMHVNTMQRIYAPYMYVMNDGQVIAANLDALRSSMHDSTYISRHTGVVYHSDPRRQSHICTISSNQLFSIVEASK